MEHALFFYCNNGQHYERLYNYGNRRKAASKRVQSQAGLGFAEREQVRTQFKAGGGSGKTIPP